MEDSTVKQLKKSRTIKASTVGIISLTISILLEQVVIISDTLTSFGVDVGILNGVTMALTIGSLLVTTYARVDDAIKGARQ